MVRVGAPDCAVSLGVNRRLHRFRMRRARATGRAQGGMALHRQDRRAGTRPPGRHVGGRAVTGRGAPAPERRGGTHAAAGGVRLLARHGARCRGCAVRAPDLEEQRERAEVLPSDPELQRLVLVAPPLRGAEYLGPSVLAALRAEALLAWRAEIASACRHRPLADQSTRPFDAMTLE